MKEESDSKDQKCLKEAEENVDMELGNETEGKVESKTLAERREVLVQGGAAETQEKSLKGSEPTDEEHQRENVLNKSQENKK
ncbi:hypothetical protein F2Q68_00017132 [Brassica cretica]|uniref:Uncharacterized protein n=1 Tax=Brassica cretica TaxID=69181 RepID=A0A8S9HP00_BRACR|nr:hypothetical protein F2Q68_00017132 [Brassica cretica]